MCHRYACRWGVPLGTQESYGAVGLHQGVIGDTYHFSEDSLGPRADSEAEQQAVTPQIVVPPEGFMGELQELLYPVFPVKMYEIPRLFAPQTMVLPAHLVHDIIVTRKRVLANVAASLRVAAVGATNPEF